MTAVTNTITTDFRILHKANTIEKCRTPSNGPKAKIYRLTLRNVI